MVRILNLGRAQFLNWLQTMAKRPKDFKKVVENTGPVQIQYARNSIEKYVHQKSRKTNEF